MCKMITILCLLLTICFCTNEATESLPIPEEIIKSFLKTQKDEKIIDTDFTQNDLQLFKKGQESEDLKLTVEELIKKNGYPVETYKVKTEDGYILTLFRIPSSGEPVLFMHGILLSSDDWVTPGQESGLAYLLAAEGFDVWLGNVRGNKHSREHVRLSPDSAEFWDFSWDEMGRYDLPAIIDFILKTTQRHTLKYIGHSQGTTAFFVMGSEKSEYRKKVSMMIAMAPAAAIPNQRSTFLNFLKYISVNNPELISRAIGKESNEFMPPREIIEGLRPSVCGNSELAVNICSNPVFLINGFSYSQLNVSNSPLLLAHVPSGASVKQINHYAQTIASGKFETYNKESNNNTLRPKTLREYEVGKIDTPMVIFYSKNDWAVTEPDALNLINKLNPKYVIDVYKVPHPTFNHLDFMYGVGIKSLIFPRIIKHFK